MGTTQQAKPSIGPGIRIYAVGDIHGRFDLLQKLMRMIRVDADQRQNNKLVFLGDYVDRGPDSRGVIEFLTNPTPAGFDVICLKGNHEDYMLQFLEGRSSSMAWLRNGGREALESYGVKPGDNEEEMRNSLLSLIPGAHLKFLSSLQLWHKEGDYLFVHAGVRPGVPLAEQSEEDLIWIRDKFLNSNQNFGHMVVHGHSISREPSVHANRIGLDTGAWSSDVLSALVLEGDTRRFLST